MTILLLFFASSIWNMHCLFESCIYCHSLSCFECTLKSIDSTFKYVRIISLSSSTYTHASSSWRRIRQSRSDGVWGVHICAQRLVGVRGVSLPLEFVCRCWDTRTDGGGDGFLLDCPCSFVPLFCIWLVGVDMTLLTLWLVAGEL